MGIVIPEGLALQHQAYIVLGEMLEWTGREDLPVISWTIKDAISTPEIVGECRAADPVRRRQDFEAWCNALGAQIPSHEGKGHGSLYMHASIPDYEGVIISLAADTAGSDG